MRKSNGVKDAVFAKKRGLSILDMAKSTWVYKKLRNFRAGIEAGISALKRAFGLDRCTWSGWEGFKRYVLSSIVSYNLLVLARIRLARPDRCLCRVPAYKGGQLRLELGKNGMLSIFAAQPGTTLVIVVILPPEWVARPFEIRGFRTDTN